MSYCLNPNCQKPQNPQQTIFCQYCGSKLLLKDRYRAIKMIGQGGFGRTFLAIDEHKPSQPHCVIKQFYPQAQGTNSLKKAAELFEQEAVRLDDLGKHPQIPELFAHFVQDNRQYLVQEFIAGNNLVEVLKIEGAFKERQIYKLLINLLPLLAFIHSHNVIHRDIKPENIIRRFSKNNLTSQDLVLVDFGAAKLATTTSLMRTGTTIGTAEYRSPEQTRGKAVFSSDLYSLGVTCINLLTKVSPFELFDMGENSWIWRQYLINNPVSNQLGRILDKLIENATNRRYQSAKEVLADLSIYQQTTILTQRSPDWQCVYTCKAHLDSVRAVAFSRDQQTVASGSYDKTIKLWLPNNNLHKILPKQSSPILAISMSPNGQILASSSTENTIKLWQTGNGQLIRTLSDHSSSVYCIAISPDGQTLVSGSADKTIKLWNLHNGKLLKTIKGHVDCIHAIAISPNGRNIASGSADRSVKLWDLQTGRLISSLTGHLNEVNSVVFSPDSQMLASGSNDHNICIWNLTINKYFILRGHLDKIYAVDFSPDGKTIASASGDKTIKIWELNKRKELCTLKGHLGKVLSVAFSTNGESLASGSSDKSIKIWRYN